MPFDGTKLDQITRLLIEARERIEQRGWCQDAYLNEDGAVCMMGALGFRDENVDEIGYFDIHMLAADRLAVAAYGETAFGIDIAEWNDERGRTKEEVLAAFDTAIGSEV